MHPRIPSHDGIKSSHYQWTGTACEKNAYPAISDRAELHEPKKSRDSYMRLESTGQKFDSGVVGATSNLCTLSLKEGKKSRFHLKGFILF